MYLILMKELMEYGGLVIQMVAGESLLFQKKVKVGG